MRAKKESLEIQRETLENENKDCCTEFNGKIYELNAEIKEKKLKIEHLSGEKEVLLSDLKNITKDRDAIQKQCSAVLKEITELAVSDKFSSSCDVKDLGNLECSVAWIKRKCCELGSLKIEQDLELMNLKQTIQELQKHVNSTTTQLKDKSSEIDKLKLELEKSSSDLKEFQSIIDRQREELDKFEEFEHNAQKLGFDRGSSLLDDVIAKLSENSAEKELECLRNEVS